MNRTPLAWNKAIEKVFKGYYYLKGDKKGQKRRGALIGMPARYPGKWPPAARNAQELYRILLPSLLVPMRRHYNQDFCIGVDLNRNFPYRWAVSK